MIASPQSKAISDVKQIVPPRGERSLSVGKTGSGKSYLNLRLLSHAPYKNVVIIDPKDEIPVQNGTRIYDANKYDPRGITVYIPVKDDYPVVLQRAFDHGNTLVYVDEVYALGGTSTTSYPDELRAICTRGRSRGVGLWACTQRPAWIPIYIMDQAGYVYVFQLKHTEDRQRIAGYIGDTAKRQMRGHNFLFYSDKMEEPQELIYEGE